MSAYAQQCKQRYTKSYTKTVFQKQKKWLPIARAVYNWICGFQIVFAGHNALRSIAEKGIVGRVF